MAPPVVGGGGGGCGVCGVGVGRGVWGEPCYFLPIALISKNNLAGESLRLSEESPALSALCPLPSSFSPSCPEPWAATMSAQR